MIPVFRLPHLVVDHLVRRSRGFCGRSRSRCACLDPPGNLAVHAVEIRLPKANRPEGNIVFASLSVP
jgi:hypothetical protein